MLIRLVYLPFHVHLLRMIPMSIYIPKMTGNEKTILDGYIEAAMKTSSDDNDRPLYDNFNKSQISRKTYKQMILDVKAFSSMNAEHTEDFSQSDYKRFGIDFWLTRNQHGSGFWDGGWKEPYDKIFTDSAHTFGEFYLYVWRKRIYG